MSSLKSHQAAALGLDVQAGRQGGAVVGDRQMEPPWMPGVTSLAGSELAELLVKKTISRFSCSVFGFGLVFFPSGYSVRCKAMCQWPGLAKQGRISFVLVTGDTSHQGTFHLTPTSLMFFPP